MPCAIVGPMNRQVPKPIKDWLTYSCSGRVRLFAWLSIQAPAAMARLATMTSLGSACSESVNTLATIPASIATITQANNSRSWSLSRLPNVSRPTAP